MFEKLSATGEWQTYAKEKALVADMITGSELQKYFLDERSKHKEILASSE